MSNLMRAVESAFLEDVAQGLSRPQKTLPCKYFYDERGSGLFEGICETEEYYLTRTELSILRERAGEMAEEIGPGCLLIEYGCGSAKKTRLLLDRLQRPAGYIPVDISGAMLQATATELRRDYPRLELVPLCADYAAPFRLPATSVAATRRVVYFPGSTLGNLSREETAAFFDLARQRVGEEGGILLGVDLRKDRAVLEAAYDDRQGVTARFHLNLLTRINRELGADFDLARFRHRAGYNEERGRIEMHLVSLAPQRVRIGPHEFVFREGETIHTESCAKYDLDEFRAFARECGFELRRMWTDPKRYFSVLFLT